MRGRAGATQTTRVTRIRAGAAGFHQAAEPLSAGTGQGPGGALGAGAQTACSEARKGPEGPSGAVPKPQISRI